MNGKIIWITGGPGAGKTTLAHRLADLFLNATILDGDEVRVWLTPDCTFTTEDRLKHSVRVLKVARLISDIGGTAIVALIAHPPAKVDTLIYVDGPNRKPLWEGTAYIKPEKPDLVVSTW